MMMTHTFDVQHSINTNAICWQLLCRNFFIINSFIHPFKHIKIIHFNLIPLVKILWIKWYRNYFPSPPHWSNKDDNFYYYYTHLDDLPSEKIKMFLFFLVQFNWWKNFHGITWTNDKIENETSNGYPLSICL